MGKRENIKIVVDGFKENKTDDEILQNLFENAGVPFGELRTVFNDIVKEKELRLTSKERKIKTIELMEGVDVSTVELMLSAVAMLETKLKVATTKAMGSLRTYAKANNIELPKAPRVAKPRKVGFGGHYKKILDWILDCKAEEKAIEKKDIVEFCHASNIPEAYATQALNVVHFAQLWAGDIEREVEAVEETKEAA